MAKLQRAEGQTELKCDADKFFDVWACKPYLIPKMFPSKVAHVALQQGEWHKAGCVQSWTYLLKECGTGENTLIDTVRVEDIDVKKREIKYDSCLDGFINKTYSTFKSTMQVAPKSDSHPQDGCIVKWMFIYEKKNEDVPETNMYISFAIDIFKAIEAYCQNST